MDFPRLVYKSPATHKLVHDLESHAEALLAGWFASVPEAVGKAVSADLKAAAKVAATPAKTPTPEVPPVAATPEAPPLVAAPTPTPAVAAKPKPRGKGTTPTAAPDVPTTAGGVAPPWAS